MTKLVKNLAFVLLLLGFITLCPSRVNAWGESGHRIVAMIAEDYLTDSARKLENPRRIQSPFIKEGRL